MYQEKIKSLYQTGATAVLAGAIGLTALLGCNNKQPESPKPSQKQTSSQSGSLENKLDLSTPEKTIDAYFRAYNSRDFDTSEKIISSQNKRYLKYVAEARKRGKAENFSRITDYSILRIEKINEQKVNVYVRGTSDRKNQPTKTTRITLIWENEGWRYLKDKSIN